MAHDTLAARATVLAEIERADLDEDVEPTHEGLASESPQAVLAARRRWRRAAVWAGATAALLLPLAWAALPARSVAHDAPARPSSERAADPVPTPPPSEPGGSTSASRESHLTLAETSASAPPERKPAPRPRAPAPSPERARGGKPNRGCDPPFSVDSLGREIFKPECL
jgi:hypothetical protein